MPNDRDPPTSVNLAIWGMHRSGTSLLCSLLASCGVHFGDHDRLVPPNEENPKGFWENIQIRDLNDAMLMATGCDWDHISRFDPAAIPDKQLSAFAEESRNIMGALGTHAISGIKEPRMCVLTEVWAPVLADSVDVFVYRHPAEIAKSLAMRNDLPFDIGLRLCEYYLVHLINYLKSRNVIAVSHQQLLQDPKEALEKISAHIDAVKGKTLQIAESESGSMVDMDYYRARLDQEQLPGPLQRIWDNLQAELSQPEKLSVAEESITLLAEYEQQESEKAFLAARRLRKQNRKQEKLLNQINRDYSTAKAEIDVLHENMTQKNASIKALKNELVDLQKSNTAIKGLSDDMAKTLSALNIHLGKLTGRFSRLILSVTSGLAGILRINSLKRIDEKLQNLSRDIDMLIKRHEAQRTQGKKKQEESDKGEGKQ